MFRLCESSCAYTAMPELSASVDELPEADGHTLARATHDVHGTYRDGAQFASEESNAFGPHASGIEFWSRNFALPNSCQVELWSWPADFQKMLSNEATTSGPTSASHLARSSAEKLLLHGV